MELLDRYADSGVSGWSIQNQTGTFDGPTSRMDWLSASGRDYKSDQDSHTDYLQGIGKRKNLFVCLLFHRSCQRLLCHDGSPDKVHCSFQRRALVEQNVLSCPGNPWGQSVSQGTITAGRRRECGIWLWWVNFFSRQGKEEENWKFIRF